MIFSHFARKNPWINYYGFRIAVELHFNGGDHTESASTQMQTQSRPVLLIYVSIVYADGYFWDFFQQFSIGTIET